MAGFSKYSTPFKYGVMKFLLASIARGISAYLPSSEFIKGYRPRCQRYKIMKIIAIVKIEVLSRFLKSNNWDEVCCDFIKITPLWLI